MPKKHLRDMVVLLPGITGSVLQKDGKDVWAPSVQAVWETLVSMGESLQHLRLKGDDPQLDELGDGIRASALVPDVHLVPGLVTIDGYSKTISSIMDSFDVLQGSIQDEKPANFFAFPYDWRRDNRIAARRLKRLIDRQLPLWREYSGEENARVILIGHSMGGLVARYYLEVLEGWRDCKALITFGTPYRGSLDAVGYLANGYKKMFLDLTDVMRSFTSVYQLMPIYKVVTAGETVGRIAEVDGIPNIEQMHAEQALAFHREIEAAVNAHLEDNDYLRQRYELLPIVGIRQLTNQSCELVNGGLSVSRNLPVGIDPLFRDGDGTVPMLSAIPIEMSEEYHDTFFAERHGSLQCNDTILNDLLGRLQRMQAVGLETIREPKIRREIALSPAISLDLDDLYMADEPIELRARLINVPEPTGRLIAHIEAISGDELQVMEGVFRREGDEWLLKKEGVPPGLYRLEVRTDRDDERSPMPVHDLFEVAH